MGRAGDAIEYAAARAIAGTVRLLPGGAVDPVGEGLGGAIYRLGARTAIVRRQIAAAFPERDAAWVECTTAACYRHFGREIVEMVRLPAVVRELPGRVATDAQAERWIERMRGGEGMIVVTGHLGNWEMAGAYLAARAVPLAAVVKRQRNRRFDTWLTRLRRRLGMEPVYMGDASREVPRLLAAGHSVALVADQDAGHRGLPVSFMGRPAATFRGPARLALRTRAPLVFGTAVREDERYRIRITPVHEGGPVHQGTPMHEGAAADERVADDRATDERPVDDGATDERATDELALTRRWIGMLEAGVRERPSQYFWFHRRWKSLTGPARNERDVRTVSRADTEPVGETTPDNGEADS